MKIYHLELVPARKSGQMLLILSVRVFWYNFQNCMWSTFSTGHPQLQSPVLKGLYALKSSFGMTVDSHSISGELLHTVIFPAVQKKLNIAVIFD